VKNNRVYRKFTIEQVGKIKKKPGYIYKIEKSSNQLDFENRKYEYRIIEYNKYNTKL